jgi:hypothetical protein
MFLRNRISSNPLTEARDSSLKQSRRPGATARPTRAARAASSRRPSMIRRTADAIIRLVGSSELPQLSAAAARLFGPTSRDSHGARRRSSRLALERLECRLTPAHVTFHGGPLIAGDSSGPTSCARRSDDTDAIWSEASDAPSMGSSCTSRQQLGGAGG